MLICSINECMHNILYRTKRGYFSTLYLSSKPWLRSNGIKRNVVLRMWLMWLKKHKIYFLFYQLLVKAINFNLSNKWLSIHTYISVMFFCSKSLRYFSKTIINFNVISRWKINSWASIHLNWKWKNISFKT